MLYMQSACLAHACSDSVICKIGNHAWWNKPVNAFIPEKYVVRPYAEAIPKAFLPLHDARHLQCAMQECNMYKPGVCVYGPRCSIRHTQLPDASMEPETV